MHWYRYVILLLLLLATLHKSIHIRLHVYTYIILQIYVRSYLFLYSVLFITFVKYVLINVCTQPLEIEELCLDLSLPMPSYQNYYQVCAYFQMYICDQILGKRSKSHISQNQTNTTNG